MARFVTLTLNPALDIATSTARVEPTHKLRCDTATRYAGGGGVNVARVLHRLGADVLAWALAGGPAGAQLVQRLEDEGVPVHAQPIAGDTRENLSVMDRSSGLEYRFVLPGPTLHAADWHTCRQGLQAMASAPHWLVASGSLPPGLPDSTYADLAGLARTQGWRLVVDTSGPALAQALAAGVAVAKPSLRELRDTTGLPLEAPTDWARATQALVQAGQAEVVALSLGEQGALLATREGVWRAPALALTAATGTTGAGDCFLATLLWALDAGHPPPEALRWAVAGGGAALLTPGTGLAQAGDLHRLVQDVPAPQRLD